MEIKKVVKEKYGQAALRVQSGESSCCGTRAALNLFRSVRDELRGYLRREVRSRGSAFSDMA